jgi:CelD/BcsL family acetyltransferase involved in cellulose biosynthesis
VREAVLALERLHGLRWREKGKQGVLSDPLMSAFLKEVIPELSRSGILRLHQIMLGGTIIAVLFALYGHGATYYYLSGFDPKFSALRPGAVLTGAAMAEAAKEGDSAFHFLRGQEGYKYHWGAEDRGTCRRRLIRITATRKPNIIS